MVVQAALGEQLQEVGVRAKVKWGLLLVVLEVELGSIGGQEDGNGSTALFV